MFVKKMQTFYSKRVNSNKKEKKADLNLYGYNRFHVIDRVLMSRT